MCGRLGTVESVLGLSSSEREGEVEVVNKVERLEGRMDQVESVLADRESFQKVRKGRKVEPVVAAGVL